MSIIIFLNGCGSAGKTSLAKQIQNIADKPFINIGGDNFIDMLPAKYIDNGMYAKEGYYHFVKSQNSNGENIKIEKSPLGNRIFNLIPDIISQIADNSNDIIIDEVILSLESLKKYIDKLKNHQVYFIKVYCELKILLERERSRGNRAIGLVNDQYNRVYNENYIYDLELNSNINSSEKMANEILRYISSNLSPKSFKRMENW